MSLRPFPLRSVVRYVSSIVITWACATKASITGLPDFSQQCRYATRSEIVEHSFWFTAARQNPEKKNSRRNIRIFIIPTVCVASVKESHEARGGGKGVFIGTLGGVRARWKYGRSYLTWFHLLYEIAGRDLSRRARFS